MKDGKKLTASLIKELCIKKNIKKDTLLLLKFAGFLYCSESETFFSPLSVVRSRLKNHQWWA